MTGASGRAWRFADAAVIAALCTVLSATGLSAQRLGLDARATHAGYAGVLADPVGLVGSFEMGFVPPLLLRFWVGLAVEHHERFGPTCTGLIGPDQPCPTDTMDGRSVLRQMGVEVGYALPAWGPLRARLLAGGVVSSVSSRFVGRETARTISPIAPGGSIGWTATGELGWVLGPGFELVASAARTDPRFISCGADAWFAFCEERIWWSGSLGARWSVPPASR